VRNCACLVIWWRLAQLGLGGDRNHCVPCK
jgi:hypothetical protein